MRFGIIALVVIFFASGVKNLQDAKKQKEHAQSQTDTTYSRRKFGFAILMFLVGALIAIYYFVTM